MALLLSAAERLGMYSRGHYEEHFGELILNMGQ